MAAFVFVAPFAAVVAPVFIVTLLAVYVWTGTMPSELVVTATKLPRGKADPQADKIRADLEGSTIH
jgi:hypothetical protein